MRKVLRCSVRIAQRSAGCLSLIAQTSAAKFAEYCGEIAEYCSEIRRVLRRNSQSQRSAAKFAEVCGETRRGLHPGNPVYQDGDLPPRGRARPGGGRGGPSDRRGPLWGSGHRGTPPPPSFARVAGPGRLKRRFDPHFVPSWEARFLPADLARQLSHWPARQSSLGRNWVHLC